MKDAIRSVIARVGDSDTLAAITGNTAEVSRKLLGIPNGRCLLFLKKCYNINRGEGMICSIKI